MQAWPAGVLGGSNISMAFPGLCPCLGSELAIPRLHSSGVFNRIGLGMKVNLWRGHVISRNVYEIWIWSRLPISGLAQLTMHVFLPLPQNAISCASTLYLLR